MIYGYTVFGYLRSPAVGYRSAFLLSYNYCAYITFYYPTKKLKQRVGKCNIPERDWTQMLQ